MDVTWAVKYITEFLGTAILIILGNGAVANVELKGTKGHQSGWLVIAVGYGMRILPLGTSCALHYCTIIGSDIWTSISSSESPPLLFTNNKS